MDRDEFMNHEDENSEDDDLPETIDRMVGDLRRYAGGMLGRLQGGITLQPTELVNMAFLKLHDQQHLAHGHDPSPIFGLYITTMKNLLRDHLRKRKRMKHGGGKSRAEVGVIAELEGRKQDPAAILELLDELETMDERRKVQVVVARIFYKLTNEEIAAQLGVSTGTVEDDLRKAKAWLKQRLTPS